MDNETLIKENFDNTPQKNNKMTEIFSSRKTAYLFIFILIALISTVIRFLPSSQIPEKGISLRTIRVKGYPITLILEQQEGIVTSCWLRTPAGSREIENINGMTFISETTFISTVDQDEEDDLLWRLSFINFSLFEFDFYNSKVCVRSGPTERYLIGTSNSFSKNAI